MQYSAPKRIYTITELTSAIKRLLEENFPFVWVIGEISNFSRPSSGHIYFTLKDKNAQISAVMFRNQNRQLKFDPNNGMQITGFGRISLFEPRGTYQIILEYLEPKGIGALQIAFEQLKEKLNQQGYFNQEHKKKLPFLPRKISLITSPTGAVVHDMINIIHRRFENIHLEVIPVRVQGLEASKMIVEAIKILNDRHDSDLAILARGGGSLEDLQAFNSESVANAIFCSEIPIVSAVGHETDFTIADFVADLRAPTPSAAAELIVPVKSELEIQRLKLHQKLLSATQKTSEQYRRYIAELNLKLKSPKKQLDTFYLKIDDLFARLQNTTQKFIYNKQQNLKWRLQNLYANSPLHILHNHKVKLKLIDSNLLSLYKIHITNKQAVLKVLSGKLQTLSPQNILNRGYSITRRLDNQKVIAHIDAVDINEPVEVILNQGALICDVKNKQNKTDF